ncbi:Flavin reductase [Harpegnathos saltator]|uniref:Flavin reductase n=1 Tax=Harpegnathos saltator TaxID=610380 RepID=E2BW00_HARSA|nr:Flavin reductase [Harpegnathos saltator]
MKAIAGTDAVVVALGTRNDLSPTTVLSCGLKNIISAMKAYNVELVSVCLSGKMQLKQKLHICNFFLIAHIYIYNIHNIRARHVYIYPHI